MSVQGDDWIRGFACALGQMVAFGHDMSTVRHLMSANGFNMKTLTDAGVDDVDVERIWRALKVTLGRCTCGMGPGARWQRHAAACGLFAEAPHR